MDLFGSLMNFLDGFLVHKRSGYGAYTIQNANLCNIVCINMINIV